METNQNETTIVTKEEQIAEAIARMKQLEIMPQAIQEFRKEQLVNKSQNCILFWVEQGTELAKEIQDFEKEYNAVVYHVIETKLKDGSTWYSCLYVSQNKDEWHDDRMDLAESFPYSYVIGYEKEIGRIEIVTALGGVARVG